MNRFTAFAAAVALATALSSVAAKADFNYGPIKNGNQCWTKATHNGRANDGFGYWSECPKEASAPVTTTHRVRHSRQQ